MNRTIRVGLGTAAAIAVLGAVEVLLAQALITQWRVVGSPGPASLAEALTLIVLAVAVGLGAWLALSTLGAVLAHLPGGLGDAAERWACACAPAVSRRVAAVLVGAAVGGALAPGTALGDGSAAPAAVGPGFVATAGPGFVAIAPGRGSDAQVAPGFSVTTRADSASGLPAAPKPSLGLPAGPQPAPGWTPSRPTQRPQPASGLVTAGHRSATAGHHSAANADVVVQRGDTLWDIARRHLGPDASDAEVAAAWPAWHEANCAVIGNDPDLILPGQILQPPGLLASSRAATAPAPARPSGTAR